MTHYDYRMVSAVVWSAAYALASMVMELWLADRLHARGDESGAAKHMANALDLHGQIRARRDYYDRAGED